MNEQIVQTEVGFQALFNPGNTGLEADIFSVRLGDGQYEVIQNADGRTAQAALQHERDEVTFRQGKRVTPGQIDIAFLVESQNAYWVHEMGFYLADGTLFAVWSDPVNALAWKAAGAPLAVGLSWVLGSLSDTAITVQHEGPPLELLMTREVAVIGSAMAHLQLQQLRQADRLAALENKP